MASAELNALRSQALHLTKRSTHKISRLKSKQDVIVAGSEYDTRVSPKLIRRYNIIQLQAYIRRQEQFVARSTQFVPDAQHRPIPAAEFKQLHMVQQARYDAAQAQLNAKGDTLLPGSYDAKGNLQPGYETIKQRRDKMRSDRKLAGNPSVNDPYEPKVNKSTDIANRHALKALIKEAKSKTGPGWDKKELKRQIGEFSQMIDRIGDTESAQRVGKLSAAQFRTLWNDTPFATAISQQYEISKSKLIAESDIPWHAQVISDAFADARKLIDWAEQLDPETGAAKVDQGKQPKAPAKPKRDRDKYGPKRKQ